MEIEQNIIRIQRATSFQGERCVGIDSGALTSMIYNEEAFQKQIDSIRNSLFNFSHEECVGGNKIKIQNSEVFKVLTNKKKKYKLESEEAINKINEFLKKYNINVIPDTRTNWKIVNDLYFRGKKRNIEVHPPDVWIIADFKSKGVNLVYSNNKHFRALCKLLGMSAPDFFTDEGQTNKMYWDVFGGHKNKKFKKKR